MLPQTHRDLDFSFDDSNFIPLVTIVNHLKTSSTPHTAHRSGLYSLTQLGGTVYINIKMDSCSPQALEIVKLTILTHIKRLLWFLWISTNVPSRSWFESPKFNALSVYGWPQLLISRLSPSIILMTASVNTERRHFHWRASNNFILLSDISVLIRKRSASWHF